MTQERRTAVVAARSMLGLDVTQLWMDALALGGTATIFELNDYLAGTADLPAHEYDVVAQALNERFVDEGGDHPVPYAEDS